LERIPIAWTHVIEKDTLEIKKLEHVLVEKVEKLFRDMLWVRVTKMRLCEYLARDKKSGHRLSGASLSAYPALSLQNRSRS